MQEAKILNYLKSVLEHMPSDWLNLTTHRLDIYDESRAKSQFLDQFESLFKDNISDTVVLNELPTAYDYIRLGHPLSSILEWTIASLHNLDPESVINFSSQTMPVLAVLRKNFLHNKKTQIIYNTQLPDCFNEEVLKTVYGYGFEIKKIENIDDIPSFDGSTIVITQHDRITISDLNKNIDFYVNIYENLGSLLLINGSQNESYISEIQHVRRRETIAMTPSNSLIVLKALTSQTSFKTIKSNTTENKTLVEKEINQITNTQSKPLIASSGLSIQYAIMMGLVHNAQKNHKGKAIKLVVPPNCYGGTNDQARRVAAVTENVTVVDLPVDGDNDMVQSVETVLTAIAQEDAIPYIIAEIPTNPRVEVPDLLKLKDALSKERKTAKGEKAIDPVFILDQTFCPNVHFLGQNDILSSVRTLSYASGSKFPSGGKCTAGYVVSNEKASTLMSSIEMHLDICDNEATDLQYQILAEQLPSMNKRIADAYKNTREFVTFIEETLPEAKINFVSPELAKQEFTPSVFSLDLPTKGSTPEEKETYKRALNLKLINLMITEIPKESKYCVSYGQLKGCYWTIPATSTQGTTKEGDKDYIVRASLSPDLDLQHHKAVFKKFIEEI